MEGWPINIGDLVVLGVLLISAILAFARGFIHEVLSIGAWIGATLAAITFYPSVSPFVLSITWPEWIPYLGSQPTPPWLADILAGTGVFIVTLIVLSVVSYYISSLVRASAINAVDRSLGFVFGLARGAVLLCLAYLLLAWLVPEPEKHPAWVRGARTLPLVERGAAWLATLVPEDALPDAIGRATAPAEPEGPTLLDQLGQPPKPQTAPPDDRTGYDQGNRIPLDQLIENVQ